MRNHTEKGSNRDRFNLLRLIFFAALALGLSGCFILGGPRRTQTASIVDFLFGKDDFELQEPRIPRLNLPLHVGIAFVPSNLSRSFAPQEQAVLLNEVQAAFEDLEFVSEISIIPSTYMRDHGGFENLDQLQRWLKIDVVVLLGYDQVQSQDSTLASIAVLTIVGSYIIPSERVGVHTLLEGAVYDINSRSLLFRAAGGSTVDNSYTTSAALEHEVRRKAYQGYELAVKDLIENLRVNLELFRKRVRENPAEYEIVHRPGYTGGGSLGIFALGLLVVFLVRVLRRRSGRRGALDCAP